MVVKITMLNTLGHEEVTLTKEEAFKLVTAERGKYYVVDAKTRELIRNIVIEDGQELVLMPVVSGG